MPFDFSTVSAGDTAWVLASSALVLLMTPALAFFYAGMVRAKNALAMLMQNYLTIGLVTAAWAVLGFSLAFGQGSGFVGDLHFAGLANLTDVVPGFTGPHAQTIPPMAFALFQLMFAVITPALITGSTADRMRLGALVPFILLWSVLVYAPVAHWVFSPDGWAAKLGALDFAGGTVVHSNAGAAGLAMAIVLGRRAGWPTKPMHPHNLPFVLLGAALLWVGWLGFNAGSALAANNLAAFAAMNTTVAASLAMLAWAAVEKIRYGKATSLGAASGAVAGLVAITPCAGFVSPTGAIIVGIAAGAICALAVSLKTWLGYDDSLDVVGVHLFGGVVGSLCVGLFATTAVNPLGADGLFYGGGYDLLGKQLVTVLAVVVYSFVVTLVLGRLIDRFVGIRVSPGAESAGLDLALHGETAYEFAAYAIEEDPGHPVTGGEHRRERIG
ncbi:MAG TPA: ammonium transporter [Mycobacteriales bacterium]